MLAQNGCCVPPMWWVLLLHINCQKTSEKLCINNIIHYYYVYSVTLVWNWPWCSWRTARSTSCSSLCPLRVLWKALYTSWPGSCGSPWGSCSAAASLWRCSGGDPQSPPHPWWSLERTTKTIWVRWDYSCVNHSQTCSMWASTSVLSDLLRYSGIRSSQLSMMKTLLTYSLMLFFFFLFSKRSKGARRGTKSRARNSSWPSTEKCCRRKQKVNY